MKTYNVELTFLDSTQRNYWISFLKTEAEIYNKMVAIIQSENLALNRKIIHDRCYRFLREQYPEIPAQTFCVVEVEVLSNLKTLKTLQKKGFQKDQKAPEKKSLSYRLDGTTYSKFTLNSIYISSGAKNKRLPVTITTYPKYEELWNKYTYHSPLLVYKNDRFFLSVSFDIPEYTITPEEETVLGIDLGLKRVASTSDGEIIKAPDYIKQRRRIRYLKRCLRSKADNGSKSAKKHLKKLQNKERNLSKNFCHLVANKLLETDKNILVLEDLTQIKEKTKTTEEGFKRKSHNNHISQMPFYLIKTILTYKAPQVHKRVETVNPSYTSQIDSRTGNQNGVRKGCRYYAVDGIVLDADVNASMNIAQRYCKHLLSFDPAIDGSYKLRKQGSVNNPIVVLSGQQAVCFS